MKLKQRALAILLSLAMVLTFMPVLAYADDDDYDFGDLPEASEMSEIEVNEEVSVTVTEEKPIATYIFVPETSGYYIFESYGNDDTVGQVRTDSEIIETNDDSGNKYNFSIVFLAEAGETYYLQAKGYDGGELTFSVKAYFEGQWTARADKKGIGEDDWYEFSGSPIELRVVVEGTFEGTFAWYKEDEQLEGDAETISVSEPGNYHCIVSDGDKSADVQFPVRYSYDYFGELSDLSELPEIKLDESKEVTVTNEEPVATYTFVPETTGYYVFESYGNENTVGRVSTDDDVVGTNDNAGEGENFRVVFLAEAGETYYLQAKGYGGGDLEFSVKAYFEGLWTASAYERTLSFSGSPVELKVVVEGTFDGTYTWYKEEEQIDGAADTIAVSEPGNYHCTVSDNERSVDVQFTVQYSYNYFGELPDTDELPAIALDEEEEVQITDEAPVATFKFVPETSGYYVFESYGSKDTVGQVRTDSEVIEFNDDSGERNNFSIVFQAEAGETYYLQAKGYDNVDLTFTVKAYFEGSWLASAYEKTLSFSGSPVELKVVVEGTFDGTYTWYKEDEQIDGDTDTIAVSELGNYHCTVSDGDKSVDVQFRVRYSYEYFGELPDTDELPAIELDKRKDVQVTDKAPVATFKFVPETSGYYIFESYGNENTVGQVRTDSEVIRINSSGGEGNFRVNFWAEAGESYYLQAKGYDNGDLTFSVKAYYEGSWLASAYEKNLSFSGSPVELKVVVEGTFDGTYTWYKEAEPIDGDTDMIAVSEPGNYHCTVSDGDKSVDVEFTVRYSVYYFGELPDTDELPAIELDKRKDVQVTDKAPVATFKFVPETSGHYIFESYGDEDAVGQVRTDSEVIEANDDAGERNNFSVVFQAEAGQTYYLQAKGYSGGDSTFSVKVYKTAVPEFTTHSLVLSGRIGVNFFMDLSELSEDEYSDTYMEFTVNGETKRVDFDPDNMNPARTYYGFTCYVNSIQMAETIYAVFHYGNGRTVSDTFSIDRYVALFEQNKDKVGADMVAVVESMADYGHYVQPFLAASNGWVIGDKYVEMATHFTDGYDYEEVKSAVAGYGIIKDYEDPDIERINYQLSLDSETEVYVLFKPAAGYTGDISFTVTDARGDTREAEPKMEGDGRYRIEISGISAHLLGTTCTVVAETENGSATVKVSAMSYVKTMLDNYTDTRYLDAAASLYKYFEAADIYKQNHN